MRLRQLSLMNSQPYVRAYINSLGLRDKSGNPVTADNYKDYLKTFLLESAHRALQEGCEISDTVGFTFYKDKSAPWEADRQPSARRYAASCRRRSRCTVFRTGNAPRFNKTSDFVTDLDLDKYLSYVASVTPLKTPPAFDQMGVLIPTPSPENKVFGNENGERPISQNSAFSTV